MGGEWMKDILGPKLSRGSDIKIRYEENGKKVGEK